MLANRLYVIFSAAALSGLVCASALTGDAAMAADAGSQSAAANANHGMYEKYKSDQQKFLDDFDGASPRLERSELMPVLFRTIQRLSRYKPPAEFPVVVTLPTGDLNRLACKGECSVLGHYAGGREIYIDSKLKPETNLFDRSVLLHEMVHYLQGLEGQGHSGLPDTEGDLGKCLLWYKREREAYTIQEAYLIMVASPVRAGYFPAVPPC